MLSIRRVCTLRFIICRSPPTIDYHLFLKIVFWNTATPSCACWFGCFLATMVKLSSCDREFMAHEAKNLYCNLVLYRKVCWTLICFANSEDNTWSFLPLFKKLYNASLSEVHGNWIHAPSYIPENIEWKICIQISVDKKIFIYMNKRS